jgi:outer membrane protein TolC
MPQSPSNLLSETTAGAPIVITLQDALQRARAINPQFQSAVTDFGVAHEEKVQARATLLPSVNQTTEFIYTEGNQTPSGRFIANNGVHEYLAQGNAHQVISLGSFADYRRTRAAEAVARARTEIAARGLVVTVVQSYYGLVIAQRKYATAQQAAAESQRFFTITQQLESGGEVARSDVIKADIQNQQVQRELQEAQLAMEKARLDLAVLLFPNFTENFTVVDDLRPPANLPSFSAVQGMAGQKNPQLAEALAAVQQASAELGVARAGYLPSLSFDYFYGIDANHFATRSSLPEFPFGVFNLGYAATASLTVPVWNWGATHSKVKQAALRQRQAKLELSAAQRELLANLRSFYNEAQIARAELESLARSAQMAAESLRLTTLRYQAGEATVLEVVDAQNTLTQSSNAYDDGQLRFRTGLANLQTLTGSF